MNDGRPVSNVLNDALRTDITFSGHTPFVSWQETVGGEARTLVAHLDGERFALDTPGGIGGAEPDLRAPISFSCATASRRACACTSRAVRSASCAARTASQSSRP